jgi:hypothetical protein
LRFGFSSRDVVHQVAYQLIVTHRGAGPDPGHPPNEWEFGIPGLTAENASETSAFAIDLGFAEIWLGQSLVNGGGPCRSQVQAVVAASVQGTLKPCHKLVFFTIAGSGIRSGYHDRSGLRKPGTSLSRNSSF